MKRTIGSDNRRGRDEHFPVRVAFEQGILQPLFLLGAPNGFFRAVRHGVRRAEITSFDDPDLQTLPPAKRAIGFLHRGLLGIHLEALFPTERSHVIVRKAGPIVVVIGVVIVLFPVG